MTGETGKLAGLLSDDIVLAADGGGKATAFRQPISGRDDVLAFIAERLSQWWRLYEWQAVNINGMRGVLLLEDRHIIAAVSFSCDENDRATGIYVMRNPDKLALLLDGKARLWAVSGFKNRR